MVAINSTLQLLVVVHHKWTIHLRIPFKIFSDLPSPETSISITATSQDMTSLGSTHELSQSRLLNSTISMVSSMQGAISSLQSSKNNLVNNILLVQQLIAWSNIFLHRQIKDQDHLCYKLVLNHMLYQLTIYLM